MAAAAIVAARHDGGDAPPNAALKRMTNVSVNIDAAM